MKKIKTKSKTKYLVVKHNDKVKFVHKFGKSMQVYTADETEVLEKDEKDLMDEEKINIK